MSNKRHNGIVSFVIRFTQELWEDQNGAPHLQWRGNIRHVQGDAVNHFTNFADAVTFMQHHLTEMTLNNVSEETMSQEEAIRENVKFWEDFAAIYNGMMFEAVEQTIKQSENVKKQMNTVVEQTIKAWQLPMTLATPAKSEPVEQQVQQLKGQVDALNTRVSMLEAALLQAQKLHPTSKQG